MRKLTNVLFVAILSLMGAFLACSEDNEDVRLTVSTQKLQVPGDGDTIQVDVKSGCGWNAESSEKWCVVSPNSGKGSGKLTVEVKRNPDTEKGRNANILLVSKDKDRETVVLQVIQEKLATYELKLVSQSVTMGSVKGSGTYESGEEVTIKAVANPNYTFTGWSDGNQDSVRKVTMKRDMTLEAKFSPVKYMLSLSSNPYGAGTLIGGGTYDYNSSVTISATASVGYTFSRWSDGNTDLSRTVTVDGNKTLTAFFTTNKYVLTLNASPAAGGTVTGGGSYDYNSSVTIKATPSTGYTFSKWNDGSTIASRTITIKDNQTLTATFTPIKYRISLSAGTGGSVTGGGTYDYNSSVTIKATPSTGYVFSEWSDGNTSASRTITVKEDQSLTARFVKATYKITLTASPSEGGEVSGDGSYEHGTSVTLKAVPNEGYTFSKWSDGSTYATRTITVTSSQDLKAVFVKGSFKLTLTAGTGGSVNGSGTYEYGDEVEIKATASTGYTFSKWSDGSTEATRTVTIKQSQSLTATFVPNKYTISLSASPSEGGEVSGDGSYDYGTSVTLKAVPNEGYTFSKWSDGSTYATRTITVTSSQDLKAVFVKGSFKLTLTAGTGGSVNGSGTYEYGDEVEIKATASAGYTFSKWSDGGTTAIRTITIKTDQTLTATFTPIKYRISLSAGTGGSVTGGGTYDYNSRVTIKATPSTGYMFSEWSDGNTSASRTITVKEDQSLTARFVKVVYKITLTASPSEGGEVSGDGSYDYGSSVLLKAVPNEGYTFSKWSDGVTTNPRTLTVTVSKSLIAYFTQSNSNPSAGEAINGKLPGKFSVSATKQVSFSKGNLQYQASTDTWRFAENQYDVIGADNENISSTYSGWIDLFGWGTSGYNSMYPYMTSTYNSDYGNGSQNIAGTNYDWGVYNAISNGGNKAGMWRTLTKAEWGYLLDTRANATNLSGRATVNGQTGYILLPDGWSIPSGLTFKTNTSNFTMNNYSASEWSKMEVAGAVFLPCAGYRRGAAVGNVGSDGYYWSSTYFSGSSAYLFYAGSVVSASLYTYRYTGLSVRLVQE